MQMVTELADRPGKNSYNQRHASAAVAARLESKFKRHKRDRSERRNSERKCPERKCIVTGNIIPTDLLFRFVLAPDATVVPDLRHKLDGRGVWVTANRSCVMEAASKGLFAQGFRTAISGSEELPGLIDSLLEKSCLNALGLARKAGKVVLGQTKVEAGGRHKSLGIILHARDGSHEGRRKIRNALLASGQSARVEVIEEFTSNQLSLALGLPNVIHAALRNGGIAAAFAKNCRTLLRYREIEASGQMAGQSTIRTKSRNIGPDNLVDFPSEDARTE